MRRAQKTTALLRSLTVRKTFWTVSDCRRDVETLQNSDCLTRFFTTVTSQGVIHQNGVFFVTNTLCNIAEPKMPPTGADGTFGNRLSLPLRLVAFFVTGCANDDTPKSQFESEYLRLIESDIAE